MQTADNNATEIMNHVKLSRMDVKSMSQQSVEASFDEACRRLLLRNALGIILDIFEHQRTHQTKKCRQFFLCDQSRAFVTSDMHFALCNISVNFELVWYNF